MHRCPMCGGKCDCNQGAGDCEHCYVDPDDLDDPTELDFPGPEPQDAYHVTLWWGWRPPIFVPRV